MTDERSSGGTLPPDPDFAPPATPPQTPQPPPLAPYANPAAATPPPQPPTPPAAWTAPPAQQPPPPPAAWGAPPPQQPPVGWAPAAAPAAPFKGKRTALAGIAGILLLLGGIGGILIGLLVVVVGGAFISNLGVIPGLDEIPEFQGADPATFIGTFVAFLGLIVAAYSVAYLLAGIGVIRNSNWARVLGIVVAIISGLIWLPGVTGSNEIPDASVARDSFVFSAIAFGIHAYIVVALMFFWRSKTPA